MKKTTVLLYILSTLIFIACGGENTQATTNSPSNITTIEGIGTIKDPYIIGSGKYPFENIEYFSFRTNKENCNVLIYNIENLNYAYGPYLYDSDFVEVDTQTTEDLYPLLSKDTYLVKVNTWDSDKKGMFGIFSPCINQPNEAYTLKELEEGVVEQSTSILYKITSDTNRIVTINVIEGYLNVNLFDNTLSLKDSGEFKQSYSMSLNSGINYLYIRKTLSGSIKLNISFD